MIGLLSQRVGRALAAAPLVAVLWLAGCENNVEYAGYPKGLVYPLRTDALVTAKPKEGPFAPPGPGHLDDGEIASIPKLGGEIKDPTNPKDVAPAQRALLQAALNKAFGAPRSPRVGAADGEDSELVDQLKQLKIRDDDAKAPFKTLEQGSRVYRYHCLHCHGLTGDGRGPTGPWVVPHPRDYRSGEFKFISTDPGVSDKKPRRDDLLRVLRNGIEGTSMPSFALIEIREPDKKDKETDLDAVVGYVMHLSIRGLVERRALKDVFDGNTLADANDADGHVHDLMKEVVGQWSESGGKPIVPAKGAYVENMPHKMHEASIRHGYQLFSDPKGAASCIGCHTDYGRQVNFRYDDWGTLVRPMNLTMGVYRGGRRPIDLYWRIKGGIDPSGMPKTGLDNDKDVWDVVNFVQALPYPQMLPEDVRNKVYGPTEEKSATARVEN